MITFNVGPSKVYGEVLQYLQDAYHNQILSISHRSKEFDAFSQKTLELLHSKLNIPANYTILYTGSATESWEILSQDLVMKKSSHFYNGEFGKKWFEYAKYIHPESKGFSFNENDTLHIADYDIEDDVEMLAFTLNETSTGTQVRETVIEAAHTKFPDALIAIDTTSCLGGININYKKYDIIYGSVQKCFGLPAGLGLLICSPKAINKANELGIKGRYNSLLSMVDKIKAYQTNFTPNVLGIYLLNRVLENIPNINETDLRIKKQAAEWYDFMPNIKGMGLHITNKEVRSDTVITVKATDEIVTKIKKEAKTAGIELGSGYGPLKNSTFRIANFPAISSEEINVLKKFLTSFSK